MAGEVNPNYRWVECWRTASPRLEQLRREALATVNVARAIEALEDAFQAALRHLPPSTTSGLVIQQALFRKARKQLHRDAEPDCR
jgi:cytochrome c-type biogenesis protein CcmH/NrfG